MVEPRERPLLKPIAWVGSSKTDLKKFPADVQDEIGHALLQAQLGGKHASAKPLKGFGGGGVLEIVENDDGDTYRAVYTVRFADFVYVLHAFQKKSKSGIRTPQKEIDLVKTRLRAAEEISHERSKKKSDQQKNPG
jgi:phage-related protein